MKTQSAKAKGRKLQQYAAGIIRAVFNLADEDVESRSLGSSGVDLMLSSVARKVFNFSVEAKNTKKFPSLAALKQSQANKNKGSTACVVWKPPGKGMDESIIYFNYEEFVKLWKDTHAKERL